MKPIIEINNVSKKYYLGEAQPYYSLRDVFSGFFTNPLNSIKQQTKKDEFWALKDISVTINQGDVVGVVGRNGAGKSTLLKVLSRITPPTAGEVILRGRVGSLLEVGTGFHPELSGRENIYLNGAILGMQRAEVKKKFDEIVAFAEVEKFLDTPLKRYSSGMYMRLAFAVAAHLETEILIVDEVLAVGDAEFQKKCLGKMEEVSHAGRTVLFVSHNMDAITQLCNTGILLKDGSVEFSGSINDVANKYISKKYDSTTMLSLSKKIKSKGLDVSSVLVNSSDIQEEPEIASGEKIVIETKIQSAKLGTDICISYGLRDRKSNTLVVFSHNHLEKKFFKLKKDQVITSSFDVPYLKPGEYILEVQMWLDSKLIVSEHQLGSINIKSVPFFPNYSIINDFPAPVLVHSDWKVK